MLSDDEKTIIHLIDKYTHIWEQEGKWKTPTASDSLLFLFTELSEYLDSHTEEEAFDCILMTIITSKALSFYLNDVSTMEIVDDNELMPTLHKLIESYLRTQAYIRNNDKFFSSAVNLKLIFNSMIAKLDDPVKVAINKLTNMHLNRVGFVTTSNLTKCFDEVTDNFTELNETLKNSLISPKSLEDLQASIFRLSEYIYE